MLVGEAGIGKTRMAEELAAVAKQEGFIVRWGESHEAEGAPPFWPWIQALREQLGRSDVTDLSVLMGLDTTHFHRHAPESARFRLFDATSTFVKNVAGKTPMLMVLDDLHWADPPTLLLLEFLARSLTRSPVLLLGTYRSVELDSHHALSETLGELARARLRTFELGGLNENAVRQLLEDALGAPPTLELLRTVQAQTEGQSFLRHRDRTFTGTRKNPWARARTKLVSDSRKCKSHGRATTPSTLRAFSQRARNGSGHRSRVRLWVTRRAAFRCFRRSASESHRRGARRPHHRRDVRWFRTIQIQARPHTRSSVSRAFAESPRAPSCPHRENTREEE